MVSRRGLSAKGAATRQRIIEAAAALIREKGAANTNLDDVLHATSTSKSQLFHYLPGGREDLLRAVAEHEAAQVLASQQPWLSDLTTWRKWQAWRRTVIAHYVELGDRCPLGALTSHLGKTSPAARGIVSELFDTWESYLVAGVRAVQRSEGSDSSRNSTEVARAILTSIQGGVVMLQATGRVAYLDAALSTALEPLRPLKRIAA
jgi:AcrR family transcriptional regulator